MAAWLKSPVPACIFAGQRRVHITVKAFSEMGRGFDMFDRNCDVVAQHAKRRAEQQTVVSVLNAKGRTSVQPYFHRSHYNSNLYNGAFIQLCFSKPTYDPWHSRLAHRLLVIISIEELG